MHECPNCNQVCDCDGDDLWRTAPMNCQCDCEEDLIWEDEPWEYDYDDSE